MLVIDVEYLHGVARLGPSGDAVITGQVTRGEWPPSPARLFAAFVAADGTGDRRTVTSGAGLQLLESASAPIIEADHDEDVARSPLHQRFVVENARAKNTVQNYPGRQATALRGGTQMAPRRPLVRYVYPDLEPTPQQLADLETRAARIGYLGCADSPARIRVSTVDDPPHDGERRWVPSADGAASLPVPYPGLLEHLDEAFERFRNGAAVRRSQVPDRPVRYRTAGTEVPEPEPELLWLGLEQALGPQHALRLAETFRQAVLAQMGDDAPPILHGHGITGRGYDTARYLVLPDMGRPFATGRLRGVALWLPPGADPEVVRATRMATAAVSELVSPGAFRVRVELASGDGKPMSALTAYRWSGPSRLWVSATPVVHERHRPVDLEEVTRWCAHAGYPSPARIAESRLPMIVGALALEPHDLRPRYANHRFSHITLEFDEAVRGPVVIGRGRQFGMGLLAPWRLSRD